MTTMPLRYKISDWHQLTGCQSNNSVNLSLHVTDFYNNDSLSGLRISVDHTVLGTLFACVLNASGDLVSEDASVTEDELYPGQILKELRKFGFFIMYCPREHLSGDQISYLMTLDKLGYDKIRQLSVRSNKNGHIEVKTYIVGFLSCKHERWLNNSYFSTESEFLSALENGTAINISAICKSKKFTWTWLDYVANINDIILDNT